MANTVKATEAIHFPEFMPKLYAISYPGPDTGKGSVIHPPKPRCERY
jgi:hypothetical protein